MAASPRRLGQRSLAEEEFGVERKVASGREAPRQMLVKGRASEDVVDDEDRALGGAVGEREERRHSIAAADTDLDLLDPDPRRHGAGRHLGMAHG
jgi:hypothetical protein